MRQNYSPSSRCKAFRSSAILALSLALAASAQPKDQPTDAQAIQAVFAQYKEALLQGDGAKAADIVSARTIAFYDGIVTHTLNTPREKLVGLDFISKFMVLRIRHEFTKAEISEMTGRKLLETGVNKGWISKASVANIEQLVEIKVDASEASAAMAAFPGVPAFHFLKESGQWKLDLVGSFALANAAMKQEITNAGLTEEQFIIQALRMVSSREVDERIFSPPM